MHSFIDFGVFLGAFKNGGCGSQKMSVDVNSHGLLKLCPRTAKNAPITYLVGGLNPSEKYESQLG